MVHLLITTFQIPISALSQSSNSNNVCHLGHEVTNTFVTSGNVGRQKGFFCKLIDNVYVQTHAREVYALVPCSCADRRLAV